MIPEPMLKAIAGAVVGGVLAWTASALTLTGRVTAIEQSLSRIEIRMDQSAARREKLHQE